VAAVGRVCAEEGSVRKVCPDRRRGRSQNWNRPRATDESCSATPLLALATLLVAAALLLAAEALAAALLVAAALLTATLLLAALLLGLATLLLAAEALATLLATALLLVPTLLRGLAAEALAAALLVAATLLAALLLAAEALATLLAGTLLLVAALLLGLTALLLAAVRAERIAPLLDLIRELSTGGLVGSIRGLVDALILELRGSVAVQRVLRLVGEISDTHEILLKSSPAMTAASSEVNMARHCPAFRLCSCCALFG
jgi:hypothetical protein